ncbi:MAG: ATPase [Bacteroidetes bacterium GWA2_32_17]|nr:MAG: ATPase [Bacteroidetes bacterium GWA2_32_17]
MNFVEINNISKSYGSHKALLETSFSVKKGELFGVIGPDGAGKTTLFRILTTLLLADSGSARISEYDIFKDYKKIRQIVGYMPGRFSLYQDLTVEENLAFFATIFGTTIKENYELIKDIYVQIEPFKDRQAGKLSGGMKQKLALSCALIHKPEILILDEPTTGVDAVSRKEFWDLLRKFKNMGITIIVSTPYMDEASLCDRVSLMQEGKIMQINTPDNIINNYKPILFEIHSNNMHDLLIKLRKYHNNSNVFLFGQTVHYSSINEINKDDLKMYLKNNGHANVEINVCTPTIEDCFLWLMNQNN